MRKLGTILTLVLAMPVSAYAGNFYWGAMLGSAEYDDTSQKYYLYSLSGRFGYDLLPYVGFEGRVMASSTASRQSITDLGIDYMGSAFAKFSLPMGSANQVVPYALVGYSAARISYTQGSQDIYFNSNGPSAGVGIELYADESNAINFEWTRLLDQTESGVEFIVDQWGIGYVHRF